jgi:hypothetical protein
VYICIFIYLSALGAEAGLERSPRVTASTAPYSQKAKLHDVGERRDAVDTSCRGLATLGAARGVVRTRSRGAHGARREGRSQSRVCSRHHETHDLRLTADHSMHYPTKSPARPVPKESMTRCTSQVMA